MKIRGLKLVELLRILMIADTMKIKIDRNKLIKLAGYEGGGVYYTLNNLENMGIIEIDQTGTITVTEEGRKLLKKLFRWDRLIISNFSWIFFAEAVILLLLVYLITSPFTILNPTTPEQIAIVCSLVLPWSIRIITVTALVFDIIGMTFALAKYKETRKIQKIIRNS